MLVHNFFLFTSSHSLSLCFSFPPSTFSCVMQHMGKEMHHSKSPNYNLINTFKFHTRIGAHLDSAVFFILLHVSNSIYQILNECKCWEWNHTIKFSWEWMRNQNKIRIKYERKTDFYLNPLPACELRSQRMQQNTWIFCSRSKRRLIFIWNIKLCIKWSYILFIYDFNIENEYHSVHSISSTIYYSQSNQNIFWWWLFIEGIIDSIPTVMIHFTISTWTILYRIIHFYLLISFHTFGVGVTWLSTIISIYSIKINAPLYCLLSGCLNRLLNAFNTHHLRCVFSQFHSIWWLNFYDYILLSN